MSYSLWLWRQSVRQPEVKLALIGLLFMTFFGCGRSVTPDEYVNICQSARTEVPVALQMEVLFGNAHHSIVHFNCDSSPKNWQTMVFFGGRYELVMEVEVMVDCRNRSVSQTGTPKFYLSEVEKIKDLGGGRFSVSYHLDQYFEFSQTEWDTIYESHGDWSKVGYTINKTPVADFDKYVSAFTKDIIGITLLPQTEGESKKSQSP